MTDQVNEAVAWMIGNPDGTVNPIGAIYHHRENCQQHIDGYGGKLAASIIPLYTHPSRGVVDEVAERRALNKALDALDALSERWASEIGLDAMCANLAKAEDVPAAIRAMAVQAWVEGAYAGRTSHQAAAPPADQHPDDAAVDRFAAAMKAKLAEARAKGRGGWHEPDLQQRLSDMLREHVDKGDPRDVANFACFLFNRGEAIAPAALPAVQDGWVSVSERLPEEGVLVLVYVPDAGDGERFDQDYIEDGAWAIHNEHREHYLAVGGSAAAGPDVVCTGPSEGAPYTHWKPLRAPAATPAQEGEW